MRNRCRTAGSEMRLLTFVGMSVVAAVCASTAALAFQEQQGGAIAPQPGEAAQPSAPAPDKGLGIGDISATPNKPSSEGTEVRIPGLGKLGVLPKMDFGLELLYGAAEQQKPADNDVTEPNSDDLTIRGSVKHRF